jgi:Outer membrane protein beta-barrel domain
MKKWIVIILSLPFFITENRAQLKIGIKAGLNFANISSTAGFTNSNRTGYMIGGYIAPKAKKLFGFRSEIMLSRQGYHYKTNTNTGNVNLDYLLLPQLITLNFGKKINIHAGPQAAILLNATADSTNGTSNNTLFDYFRRFDYGLAGGVEVSPISGFFVGGRVNISLSNANNEAPLGGSWPGFIPRLQAKNNLVQVYAGWRF